MLRSYHAFMNTLSWSHLDPSQARQAMAQFPQLSVISALSVVGLLAFASGCAYSNHPAAASALGTPRSSAELEALVDEPGPITVETLVAADWQVPLSGLLNLEHAEAQGAGLEDRDEPIQIYLHALRHPAHGLFLIDSGVESALTQDPEHATVRGLVALVAKTDQIRVRVDTRTWLERQGEPLRGVFLTHLHLDHILGLSDVPAATPLYTGPGETQATAFQNLFVQHITDRALSGHGPLAEWQFAPDAAGRFAGVLDIFGDGSVWALHMPGHTAGSTAYLARTANGPVLFSGDACHTAWGWEHKVEPGTFSSDQAQSRRSLLALEELVARHPRMEVRLGHQPFAGSGAALSTLQTPSIK
jgi:N-acyl homoserine lactone hydrolase